MSIIYKYIHYSLLFLPMLAVYLPTVFYPVTDEIGKNVSFRPPGYVFAIVWPILLFFLGISWFRGRNYNKLININILYILLIILLAILIFLHPVMLQIVETQH